MAERPLPAYEGDEPYVFVSYSHDDAGVVYPEIRWLQDQGFNVWYDEGISGATRWRDAIADRLGGCRLFLYFVSPHSVDSRVCREELEFVLDLGRPVLSIHLEPTDLPDGIKLAISNRQALFRQELGPGDYERKLVSAIATYLDQPVPEEVSSHLIRRRGFSVGMLPAIVLVIIFALIVAGVLVLNTEQTGPDGSQVLKYTIPLPRGGLTFEQRLSPNGQMIAIQSVVGADTQVFVRELASWSFQPLPASDGVTGLFWSPDSRLIAFFADEKLKTVAANGGTAQVLADVPGLLGASGTWGSRGTIIIAPSNKYSPGPLRWVSATGGESKQLTTTEPGESHLYPEFLPDGEHFLFTSIGGSAPGIYIGDMSNVGSPIVKRLLGDISSAHFLPASSSGNDELLFFIRDGKLVAQSFDSELLELADTPFIVLDRAPYNDDGSAGISVSDNGTFVYFAGSGRETNSQTVWLDRYGNAGPSEGEMGWATPVSVSPDGSVMARIQRPTVVGYTGDIWLRDLNRGTDRRLTFDGVTDIASNLVWSPDSQQVVFSARTDGVFNLYWKDVQSSSEPKPLVVTDHSKYATDWSRDGRYLLYTELDPQAKADLWYLPLGGDRGSGNGGSSKPVPFLQTPYEESAAQVSPDGLWIAYTSDEADLTGRSDVYVRPFRGGDRVWRVSEGGGIQPRWSMDGSELYFIGGPAGEPALMRATVKINEPEAPARFEIESIESLFSSRINGFHPATGTFFYFVSRDGTRFLVNQIQGSDLKVINVVFNWQRDKEVPEYSY